MLDTDTCIALIKRRPPELIQRLQAKAVGDVGMSSITLAELRHGVARGGLIAGHALSLNIVLVAHNTRELKRVKGLRLDDWLKKS
jgi:predicted nucleic acid-binding protein